MGAAEWIALGGLAAVLAGATFALGRMMASRPIPPPEDAPTIPPLAQLQHDVRQTRAVVTALGEEMRMVLAHLEASREFRWPTLTRTIERQSKALEDAASSLRLLADRVARLLASAGSHGDSVG